MSAPAAPCAPGASERIKAACETAKRETEVADDYYTAASLLNKGAGDDNLFRLFAERNLALLAEGGSLKLRRLCRAVARLARFPPRTAHDR